MKKEKNKGSGKESYINKSINNNSLNKISIDFLSKKHNIPKSEFVKFLNNFSKNKKLAISENTLTENISNEKLEVPCGIFREISPLEALVKYLRENKKISYKTISEIIGRSESGLRATYSNVTRKYPKIIFSELEISGPILDLKLYDKKLSVLEWVSNTLKKSGLKYSEISKILNKDERTVWTTNNRAERKISKSDLEIKSNSQVDKKNKE